jgi:hypothetical protein
MGFIQSVVAKTTYNNAFLSAVAELEKNFEKL